MINGERLRARRNELELKTMELSSMTGISYATINNLENNKTPDLETVTLIRLVDALAISPEYIVGDSDKKETLEQPIFPTNIYDKIKDGFRETGELKKGHGILEIAKDHPELPFLYAKRWHENALVGNVRKFSQYLGCPLRDLISITAEQKAADLQSEANELEELENYFAELKKVLD